MAKLSYEDKLDIYNSRKKGNTISSLSKKYNIREFHIKYLIRLIDKHGFDIIRTSKNKIYSNEFKETAINRVLINGETICSVAIDVGLSSDGMLHNWINKYKKNGYNIVERKRGRPPMFKKAKTKKKETIEEENERLKKENLYLRAELEYSKKLRAVVQARKNQQQKRK